MGPPTTKHSILEPILNYLYQKLVSSKKHFDMKYFKPIVSFSYIYFFYKSIIFNNIKIFNII